MARWRLRVAHYLNGHPPDLEITEWEYKETDRVNGRERRKRFKVPFYFDADTVVCYEGNGQPTDGIFEGEPGPEMEPLDKEAEEISAQFAHKWKHPIDSLEGQFSSASMLGALERQVAEAMAKMATSNTPAIDAYLTKKEVVSKAEFDELKAQLAELMAQNAELQAGGPKGGRRSI